MASGDEPVGMSLSDDPAEPARFVFPAGETIKPGEYLVLYADSGAITPGLHLGFALDASGETLSLYDKAGVVVDSVQFGHRRRTCPSGASATQANGT